MYHIFFIYSSADGHLGCFHVPGIVSTAAMNTGGTYLLDYVFSRYIPRNSIAGS